MNVLTNIPKLISEFHFTPMLSTRWAIRVPFEWIPRVTKKEHKRNSSKRKNADSVETRSYCFVGYPDEEQCHALFQNIGNARAMWNMMVADRKNTGTFHTPAYYKKLPEHEWLKLGDSMALCNVQLRFESAVSDYESELALATANMNLNNSIETVFMVAKPELSFLSSSVAKEIASFNGDISDYIPARIIKEVSEKLYK